MNRAGGRDTTLETHLCYRAPQTAAPIFLLGNLPALEYVILSLCTGVLMRTIRGFLIPAMLLSSLSVCSAQQKPVEPLHAPDGGTIERFASIFISAIADAPFTATVNTEWVRHLPDGSNITLVNHRTVARDRNGRIYQERASFVPDDGQHESRVTQIEIGDPATNQLYICQPAQRVCHVRGLSLNAGAEFAAVAPAKAGTPGFSVETLGTQYVSGLETIGTRETHILAAASYGNEAPILERKEFWYSPQLGINLITKREDPRFSSQQNFEVTNLALGEPDANLFTPPAGYDLIHDLGNRPNVSATPAASQN